MDERENARLDGRDFDPAGFDVPEDAGGWEGDGEVLAEAADGAEAADMAEAADGAAEAGGPAGAFSRQQAQRRSFSRAAVERDIAEGRIGSGAAPAPARTLLSDKRTRNVLAVIAGLVIVFAAGAFAFVNGVMGSLNSGVDQDLRDALVQTDMAKEPFYMLLLGTDESAKREAEEDFGGMYRSDTMILARVDVPNGKVTLVSIPRDIPVELGEYGTQKMNAAYAFGGPALAVKTVSEFAGVPISHFAQINFDGFESMVDALGGVEVNVPMYIDDWEAGGVVEAGEQTLDGEHALILCRSRNAFSEFGDGDAYRAANQRLVISAIARKALSSDVATIAHTVQVASEYVTCDLALNEIVGLAQALRGLDPDADIYTASVPTTSQYVDDLWYEYPNREEWAAMMERVKAGLPPVEASEVDSQTGVVLASAGDGVTVAPADKRAVVSVKNATEVTGLASRVRMNLMDVGYVNVIIGDVSSGYSYPYTLVVYDDPSLEEQAQAILDVVGQGQLYCDEDGVYVMGDADFLVVIGDDWEQE